MGWRGDLADALDDIDDNGDINSDDAKDHGGRVTIKNDDDERSCSDDLKIYDGHTEIYKRYCTHTDFYRIGSN